ncbi:ABC transporter ATP-binding protein [Pantoea eucalypti]|uniref:ABC transporter ATP-binding protein n=1 Tax=Pantoea TaxID=53335 RepID=UPI0001E0BAF7|nr:MULTISPECIES: ABC transporter ATP-binding protein [unclassified Pantoea]PQL27773.1 ABC transporter ATP-binding protein [Pantoea ananatis]EFM21661.1 ABC transporter related protein [Pantoea sp. aB]MBD9552871.1 ABC transporter ATP-binding protein [Pantoea sp. PNT01]MCD2357394.1 ABC transporter ATP-binding protein [Pantoea sp. MHSD4]QNQ60980.1 ABC transporter ATP-binding protein [Pantoea sp. MT58]
MSQLCNATPPGISVRQLSLTLGQQQLFSQLDLEIAGGKFTALLGASGAGKSSLMRVIAGLTPPSSGQISGSDGLPLTGRIAWMGQQDLLYPWLTIEQNVCLASRLKGEKADRDWAQYLLARVGLSQSARARPATLSGGMRQRAALARTLYTRQPVVLMDEPFSALDALTRHEIQMLAAEVLVGHTVLLITHDAAEACRLSHHLLVIGAAGIEASPPLQGLPPRAAEDAGLIRSQAALLKQLSGIAR